MRQIHYSFFILSQTFLTLFLLKNIFMWYEWLGIHAAFQPCFLQWNKLFPSSCPYLPHSSILLPLPQADLLVLDWQHKNVAGWCKVHRIYSEALHLSACHCRLMFLYCGGCARRRVCLCSCVRPEEEQAAGCWYWDLAAPATGPSKLLLCRVVLLYPFVVSGHESSCARSHSVWTCSPAFISSAGGWIYNGKASLSLPPWIPQMGSTPLHYLPALCLMWLTLSPTKCQVHMLTSVRQLLSLPRGHCSSCPSQCTSASSSPRAPARNTASETTAREWHTFWHQHSHQCLPLVFEHPHRTGPKGQTCHWLAGFLLYSCDTKSEILMCQFNWGAWIHNYF